MLSSLALLPRVLTPLHNCLHGGCCDHAVARAAELLTTDKLSELACLTLYLMFEKKTGEVGRVAVW